MGETDVKLLGVRLSPFVMRVRIALNLKSVNYKFIEEKHGTKSKLLLKSNPVHKKIPVLIHDNKPWIPLLNGIANAETNEAKKAALEHVREGLVLLDNAFVECSKGNSFFGGERIGCIDIALGSFLGWVGVIEKRSNLKLIDEANTPSLFEWAHKFCTHVSVKDVMHDPDELIENFRVFKPKSPPSN